MNGPFKPSSAIQKSSGKGGIYGTITKYPAAYLPVIDEPVKEPVKSLPNFIVKTPKKGSAFGNIDMLIGKDYGYESSPFGAKHDLEYNEMLKEKTLRISDKPFVSVRPTKDYFSPFHGLKYDGQVTGPTTKFKGEPITPFKPPSRLGETINPYPVYEAPNPDYKNRMVDFISDEKRRDNLFRPGPGGVAQKSFPIRSIIDANIMIRPNAWIQKEMERR